MHKVKCAFQSNKDLFGLNRSLLKAVNMEVEYCSRKALLIKNLKLKKNCIKILKSEE